MTGKGQLYALSNLLLKQASSPPPPPEVDCALQQFLSLWRRERLLPGMKLSLSSRQPCHCNDYSIQALLSKMKSLIFFIKFLCYSSYLERGKTVMYIQPVGLEWTARSFRIPVLCRSLAFPFLSPPSKGFQSSPTLLSTLLRQLPGWLSV